MALKVRIALDMSAYSAFMRGHEGVVELVQRAEEIVLNTIGDILPGTRKIAGVAQLGSGQLALVLHVDDLVESLCK